MLTLETRRLRLIALTRDQLALLLDQPAALEPALGCTVSRAVLTDRVRRALQMKLAKLERAEPERHPWFTYWLIVVRARSFGAGLAGFKGFPDSAGAAEIGYGIDPAFQNQGYTTEAVQALLAWAFAEPACRSVVAPATLKTNPASERVLAKLGLSVYAETETSRSWRLEREHFRNRSAGPAA